mgnify:CR=1 FL=1
MELVSTYYIALLYSIQFKLNKKICLYIAIDEYKKKYHINNRIFSKYFKTKFILIDKKNRYNEKKLNNYFFKKNLFNCDFEKNIYSGYVRIREVGTCNVDEKSYKKFFYNWVINFIKFQSILKKLDIKYLFISDCVYHNFGLLFKTALLQNIKVVATIPYDQSGLIGGRVYLNASNYFRETRNYLLSFTNKTLEEIQNNLKPNLINDFVQSRINGNQKIFDGSYHRNTKKMTLNEIDLSFNKKIIFHKKILIACHLLWDDSNSSYTTLYEDYEIWLSKTIDCAIINTNVLWIFKAHPSEIYLGTKRTIKDLFIEKNAFKYNNIILLEPDTIINTYSLISYVDSIITVKGSIGFEAAMLGKGVISAGTNAYSELGISLEFENADLYEYFLMTKINDINFECTHKIK